MASTVTTVFDADNHYYEAPDAFTRHLDPRLGERAVMEVQVGGRVRHVVGGRLNHAVTNPTFDPVTRPGALYGYFRGNPEGKSLREYLADAEPIRAEYRDPAARVKVMDEQGVEGVWLFPTLGVMYEEAMTGDPEAVCAAFTSFNRWLEEDWGLHFDGRIFAAPYISLADVDWAVAELTWALDHGAGVVCVRPVAPTTADGRCSPGDARFDPFWGLADEAGVTVAVHGGETGYSSNGYAGDGLAVFADRLSATKLLLDEINIERPIMDYLAALVCDRVFERFDNLRLASIENGSAYLSSLFSRLKHLNAKLPGYFASDPVESFRRHIWISPFWEEDIGHVVSLVGADHVLFGSDWPHVEGLPAPLDYLEEVQDLDEGTKRLLLGENTRSLTTLRPR
ncbi:MAG TPA: amidohydrolase family protein [Acidimicrobiales bacterium]|nr:amidohydrolase family protein [Acidimicrobiales bacterium]